MQGSFRDSFISISWSRSRMLELDKAIKEFEEIASNSDQFIDYETEAPYAVFGYSFQRSIPIEIDLLIREIVQSLRSSLDMAAASSAKLAGKSNRKKVEFPFAHNKTDFHARYEVGFKTNIPEPIFKIMKECRAYDGEGGNFPLYLLNKIRNESTHRAIVRSGIVFDEMKYQSDIEFINKNIWENSDILNTILHEIPPKFDENNNRVILGRFDPRIRNFYNFSSKFKLVLGEGSGVLAWERPMSYMEKITFEVEYIVTKIMEEAKKIGLPVIDAGMTIKSSKNLSREYVEMFNSKQ